MASDLVVQKPHRILIAGGCYAGLAAATNLLDLCEGKAPRFWPTEESSQSEIPIEITIVDERNGFYHVIGSPLALASQPYADKAWVSFDQVPGMQHKAVKIIHGSIKHINVENKTAEIVGHEGEQQLNLEYDYFVAATGLRRVWPVVPQSLTREAYLKEASSHIEAVKNAQQGVVVIGGGAVGIEMAAELKAVEPNVKVTLIHSRDRLLSAEPLPDDYKDTTLGVLRGAGVEVITGKRVLTQTPSTDGTTTALTLSDDTSLTCSVVINAISRPTPTTSYLPTEFLNSEGFVKIKPSCHFHDAYHFAAGDIALWPGIKRCGAAMHMGFHCAHNIHQHILSRSPVKSRPSSPIINRMSDSFNDIPADITTPPEPTYKELAEHPPMIGIAIGTSATVYSPTEGTKSGPEVLKYMFGDDLGFSICYNYLKLGEAIKSTTEVGAPIEVETRTAETEEDGQKTPTLSAASSASSSGSPTVEPQTPFDAVGNAEVTNFEALDTGKVIKNDLIKEIVAELEQSRLEDGSVRV